MTSQNAAAGGIRLSNDAFASIGATLAYALLRGDVMLKWAIIFAIIALIAGGLGFTGVARGAAGIAKILFGIFLIIALIFIVMVVLGVNLFD